MPERPIDRTHSREMTHTTSQKNEEIVWVIGEMRRLYSAYRIAENNVKVAEDNNRKAGMVQLMAILNKSQFQLEFALGINMTNARVIVGRDLRWVTPELQQLRHRAMGTF